MKAYQLKVTLVDAKPPVWRKFIIPSNIDFKMPHCILQLVMGWYNSHLHEFNFEKMNVVIYQEDAGDDMASGFGDNRVRKPESEKISKFIENEKVFTYTYDFGDGWEHKIELLDIFEDYPYKSAMVTNFKGNCPPEDCGGVSGYEEFLSIYQDPSHEDNESITEWANDQGYTDYDIKLVNKELKDIKSIFEL